MTISLTLNDVGIEAVLIAPRESGLEILIHCRLKSQWDRINQWIH